MHVRRVFSRREPTEARGARTSQVVPRAHVEQGEASWLRELAASRDPADTRVALWRLARIPWSPAAREVAEVALYAPTAELRVRAAHHLARREGRGALSALRAYAEHVAETGSDARELSAAGALLAAAGGADALFALLAIARRASRGTSADAVSRRFALAAAIGLLLIGGPRAREGLGTLPAEVVREAGWRIVRMRRRSS